MNWLNRSLVGIAAHALMLAVCGCSPSVGPSWGISSGSASQRVDGAMYSYSVLALTRDGQIYALVAAARGTGNSFKGGDGRYQGELHGKDGEIAWSFSAQDGQSGKVAIDNQNFDVTAGALFLVSTEDKTVHVQQVVVDAAQLQTCSDITKLLGLIKADSKTSRFLGLCKKDAQ